MATQRRLTALLCTVALFVITSVLLFPVVLTLLTSLKPMGEVISAEPTLLPQDPTLRNYVRLFSLDSFNTYMVNSLVVASLTAVIATLAAGAAAYGIVWLRVPGKRAIANSIFVAYMFPEVILVIPLFMMAYELGLIDNRFALVLIYVAFSLPFCIWVVKLYFESIPPGLVEAARLDGCSELQCLTRVALPMSVPAITSVFVLSFVLGWGEYLYANTLIMSDSHRTMAVGLQTLVGQHQTDYGLITAAGIVMVVPVLVLFALVQKYLVSDLGFSDIGR